MKEFRISFKLKTDDTWVNGDVKDMIKVVLDPVYYSEGFSVSELSVEEMEAKEWIKKTLTDYTN